MPKLERLEWIAPLSEGRGVTLSNDPEADLYLAQDANALLLGVLYDSQLATRLAFAAPLKLQRRLSHLDMARIAEADPVEFAAIFSQKPALHRFPGKFAGLTVQLASFLTARYGAEPSLLWTQATTVDDLATRLLELPGFGREKTDWTIGMLGRLEYLPFDGWDGYRTQARPPSRSSS